MACGKGGRESSNCFGPELQQVQMICHFLIMTIYTELLDKPTIPAKLQFSSCPASRTSTHIYTMVCLLFYNICNSIYTSAHKLTFKQFKRRGLFFYHLYSYFLRVLWLPGEYLRLLCLSSSSHSFCIGRTTAAVELVASFVAHRDMVSLVFRERLIGRVISSPAWLCQMC